MTRSAISLPLASIARLTAYSMPPQHGTSIRATVMLLISLDENMAACSNTAPLTEEELAKMDKVREQLGNDFCRRCNYCAPCTVGINIPSVFLFAGYLQRYDLADWAKERYSTLKVKASACIGCGKCEPRCPYRLPIREKLKVCAKDMGE